MSEQKRNSIIGEDITKQMKESYLDYAMSVITSRALPDVRDGLKPVQRRILFAMNGMGAVFNSKTRKSARITGEVIGKYHPHGNSAVYEAMVKMAQIFTTRYPLVIGQGNFGSIDGDPAGAERYTEAKMSKLAGELINDLEKETVEWRMNYENILKEPTVFPAAAPNLLLNGTLGIAVGMATNIPPHNLKEVCDATIHMIKNKDTTTSDLLKYIKGPDFPLGGIVYGKKALENAYSTGRGGVVVRGEVEIEEATRGEHNIIISSIPFRANKADLLSKIDLLAREKKIEGIKSLSDESTNDIRIVIGLKSSAQPQKVLNRLYKFTQLEDTFNFNIVALVEGVPHTLSLIDLLDNFIAHRRNIVRKRTEFDLRRAKKREHILEGLHKALSHIDEIIKLIKKSKSTKDAQEGLMKKYKFSIEQTTAILEMKLQRLVGLEREKIENDLKEVKKLIKLLETILGSERKIDGIIEEELESISKEYGNERRTKVVAHEVNSVSDEDLIPEESTVLVFTQGGYVKRTNPSEYKKQKRGGVGVQDLNTKNEDVIRILKYGSTLDTLLFFSNKGKVYKNKMYEIPEGRRATKGRSIVNFLTLTENEYVTSVLPIENKKNLDDICLFLVTKRGLTKKLSAKYFNDIRKSGFVAIKLDKDDELISVSLIEGKTDAMLITEKGQSIRFGVDSIREMGRTAKGVKGINLKDDKVVSVITLPNSEKKLKIFTVSENGCGKTTPAGEYKQQKRGGSGLKTMKITEKTGNVVSAHAIEDEDTEIIVMSQKGQVLRLTSNDLPTSGRQTQGVKVIRLKSGDSVATTTCI